MAETQPQTRYRIIKEEIVTDPAKLNPDQVVPAPVVARVPTAAVLPVVGQLAPPEDQSAAATEDVEQIYYEGSPLLRSELGRSLFWFLLGGLVIAVPFVLQRMNWVAGGVPVWAYFAAVGVGIALMVVPVLMARAIRYRISSYRIDFEKGLIGRSIDTMELWHVDDIKFRQSFVARLLGVGTIVVLSDDQTTPELELRGLPNGRSVFDVLKQRVIQIKRQKGVIKMDTGN